MSGALFEAVALALKTAGVPCSVEYPGTIQFPDAEGRFYVFGTSSENWAGDVYASAEALADGVLPVGQVETHVPSGSTNTESIARAILSEVWHEVATGEQLAIWYRDQIGYDPFADDPKTTVAEVRQTIREYLDASRNT